MIKSFRFGRALLAGLLGTISMTVLMYGWPLVGLPSMDIMAALGGVFPFEISPYVMGFLIHFGIGISLALIYTLFFDPWLPGPGWFRGALFSFIPWLKPKYFWGSGLWNPAYDIRGISDMAIYERYLDKQKYSSKGQKTLLSF